jgi:hypothetical protein
MSDDTTKPGAGAGEETFWQEADEPRSQGREWIGQLQHMIEQLATQAAPVVREVGAKAAELAALAGEKAGPVARRAAELTGEAGMKLAERSRGFAAEIRRDQAARGERASADETPAAGEVPAAGEAGEEEPTATGVS